MFQPLSHNNYLVVSSFHCKSTPVPYTQCSSLYPIIIIWLSLPSLSLPAPECLLTGYVSRRNPCVTICPKPSVDIDRLQPRSFTPFILEVTLPTRGVDGTNVIIIHHGSEVSVLLRCLEAHQVHTS